MPSLAYFVAFDVIAGLLLVGLALGLGRLLGGERPPGERDLAEALVTGGALLGVFLVVSAVLGGCVTGEDFARDVLWTAVFGASGVVLLAVAGRFGSRLILGARVAPEVARGNVAAGVAAAGHWLATGILVASCLYGRDLGTFGVSLAFFALAQVTLHLFVVGLRALTVYDDREAILDQNLAAALSYAGATVALGMVIGHAADGVYTGLGASLRAYAVSLAGSLVLYPTRQLVVGAVLARGGLVLRGGRLDEGIARDRNVGLGLLEGAAYLAAALAWVRLA